MEVINNTLVTVFPNGEIILFEENVWLEEVYRTSVCNGSQNLKVGKIAVDKNIGIFISENCFAVINSTDKSVKELTAFDKPKAIYSAIVQRDTSNNTDIVIAEGKSGIKHYSLSAETTELKKLGTYSIKFASQTVDVTDIVEVTNLT